MNSRLTSGNRRLDTVSLRNAPPVPAGARRARTPRRRRGIASMLAMLYLVLFSALALGFYTATTMSAQISRNERSMSEAQHAAESGLHFMRYKLSRIAVPPNTRDADVPAEIYIDLVQELEKSENLSSRPITASGSTISIPAITLNDNTRFSATVQWANNAGRLTVTGLASNGPLTVTRRIQVDCTLTPRGPDIFGFGIASQGPIQVKRSSETQILGNPDLDGSILSAHPGSPAIVTGAGVIEGELTVTGGPQQISLGGGSVGGESSGPAIYENAVNVIEAPEFPTIDTSAFLPFAVNKYTPGKAYYKNIRVPANSNPNFGGGDLIEGILYIESPNKVSFAGAAQVNGVIVFEGKNTELQNTMTFQGSVSPNMPNTSEFEGIREAAKGLSILAPTTAVTLTGSSDATINGSMVAYQINLSGNANISFHNGSMLAVGPNPTKIEGKILSFTGTGIVLPPTTGFSYSGYLRLDPRTYREVH